MIPKTPLPKVPYASISSLAAGISPIITSSPFLVSTKAELITEKVNEWIEENPDAEILKIVPFMSYTTIKDKGAMMIGCMIEYNLRDKNS